MSHRPTSFFDAIVYLAGTIAGICVAVVALFVIFVKDGDALIICAYIVGALCAMGLGLGYLMARRAGG